MDLDLELPESIPVMTLRDTVLFPRVVLPLYIFEERYRAMLRDVLEGNRMFAIVRQDTEKAVGSEEDEPPCAFATVGIVRGAHTNADGTSNLVLQGLARVRVGGIESETPYRVIRITRVEDDLSPGSETLSLHQSALRRRLEEEGTGESDLPEEFVEFLHAIDDPAAYIDYLAYAICPCSLTKQRVLAETSVLGRYKLIESYLDFCARRRELFLRLQGRTKDSEIPLN